MYLEVEEKKIEEVFTTAVLRNFNATQSSPSKGDRIDEKSSRGKRLR